MTRILALPALLAAVLATGCATRQALDAAYDKALAPWQGQTEQALRERWGKPDTELQTDGGGKWLTYVVTNPAGNSGGSQVRFSIGGFGWGSGLGGGAGITAPLNGGGAKSTATCTTRFLVEDGKVSSWTYDGPACGAADL